MNQRVFWLGLLAGLACSKESQVSVNTEFQGEQSGVNVVVIQSDRGRKLWVLRADTLFQSQDTVRVKHVEIDFFNRFGKQQSVLTADSGIYLQDAGDMTAFGHVVVEGNDGSLLKTKSLSYSRADSLIYTEDSVYIKSKDKEVWGIGLRSDPALKRIEIVRQVRGRGSEETWQK